MTSDQPNPAQTGQTAEHIRLVTMSRLVAHLCLAAIVLIPAGTLLLWFGVIEAADVMGVRGVNALIASPETGSLRRLGGFALTMVPQLAVIYGLVRLRHFFGGFASGPIFNDASAGHLRGFAWSLLAYALLDFIMEAPLSAYVTFLNPPGERMISFSVGGDDLHTWFLTLMFFALAHVMAEGIRLARENAEFV